jgi:hypothetical protein
MFSYYYFAASCFFVRIQLRLVAAPLRQTTPTS